MNRLLPRMYRQDVSNKASVREGLLVLFSILMTITITLVILLPHQDWFSSGEVCSSRLNGSYGVYLLSKAQVKAMPQIFMVRKLCITFISWS